MKRAVHVSKYDTWTLTIEEFVEKLGLPEGTKPLTVSVSFHDRTVTVTASPKEAR
jgi:hypothetical protein